VEGLSFLREARLIPIKRMLSSFVYLHLPSTVHYSSKEGRKGPKVGYFE
jgi:hypothetical protein